MLGSKYRKICFPQKSSNSSLRPPPTPPIGYVHCTLLLYCCSAAAFSLKPSGSIVLSAWLKSACCVGENRDTKITRFVSCLTLVNLISGKCAG